MERFARAFLLSGVALAAWPADAAFAQGEAGASTGGGLEEIVVTARRREENLQTTPISVSAFSGRTLAQMNVQEVAKIATFTPNLEMTPSGTTQGIGVAMRGIATFDPILTNEPSVGLYIDGVYVNPLSYGQFDTLELDRVEVLRGPQGTLFGRNTTGGAINIVTKRPSDSFGVDAHLRYATDNEVVSRATLNSGLLGGGLRMALTYQFRRRDGYVNDINEPRYRDPGAVRSHALRYRADADFGGGLTATYIFDMVLRRDMPPHNQTIFATPDWQAFFSQSAALGGDPLRVSPTRLEDVNPPDQPRARNNSRNNSLTLIYEISPQLTIKSISGWRHWRSREIDTFSSSSGLVVPILDPLSGTTSLQTVDPYIGGGTKRLGQFSQEIQLQGSTARLNYTVGGYYYNAKYAEDNPQTYVYVLGPATAINAAGRLAYQGGTKSYAAFGQVSYTPPILDDGLEITGGVRYTEDKKRVATQVYPNGVGPALSTRQHAKFHNTSWNVTLNYKVAPDVSVYGRIGTGYRAGGFSPRAFDGSAYDPEKAKVYEAGVKSELFDRRVRANASIFRTDYSNLQVTQPGFSPTAGFVSNVVNAGKAVYKGFEAELTVLPTTGLLIRADVGYVSPKYKSFLYPFNGVLVDIHKEAKVAYVSHWSTHIGGRYEFPRFDFGTLSIAADYSYKSKRVFEVVGSTATPDNVAGNRDILGGGPRNDVSGRIAISNISLGGTTAEFAVYGENLLNKKYRVSTIDFGALGFASGIFARPRVIGAELNVDF